METLKMIVNSSRKSEELEERLRNMRTVYHSQTSFNDKAITMYSLVNHLMDAFWYIDLSDFKSQKDWILNKIEQYENFLKK